MKRKDVFKFVLIIFWVFIIGSMIGYGVETIVAIIQNGHFASRQSLLYGPLIPVYGVGLVAYYLVISKIKDKGNLKIFIITMVLGGIVEYLFSFFQEKFFGTVSWDYSNLWFNINGRTSLLHCLYWGTGGVLFVKYIYPFIEKLINKIDILALKQITVILLVLLAFDVGISCIAANRQRERIEGVVANSSLDRFCDEYYPDSVMDYIYSNKINKIE
jgi:uncharacterized membrane protein